MMTYSLPTSFWPLRRCFKAIYDPDVDDQCSSLVHWLVIGMHLLLVVNMSQVIYFFLTPGYEHYRQPYKVYHRNESSMCLMILSTQGLFVFSAFLVHFFFVYSRKHFHKFVESSRELFVTNAEDIVQANKARWQVLQRTKLIKLPAELRQLFKDLWWPKKETIMFERKLTRAYPTMSAQLRCRVFVMQVLLEAVFIAFHFPGYFTFFFLLVRIIKAITAHDYPLWFQVMFLVEFFVASYIVLIAFHVAFLLISSISLREYSFIKAMGLINQQLVAVARRTSLRPYEVSRRLSNKIYRFLHAQSTMIIRVHDLNVKHTRIFVLYLCINVPVNAHFLLMVFVRPIAAEDRLILFLVILVQINGTVIAIIPLAFTSASVHASADYFVRIQQLLARPVLLKCKWLSRYELINSHQKIGYSAGPADVVTFKILFESFLLYLAFILFMLELLQN